MFWYKPNSGIALASELAVRRRDPRRLDGVTDGLTGTAGNAADVLARTATALTRGLLQRLEDGPVAERGDAARHGCRHLEHDDPARLLAGTEGHLGHLIRCAVLCSGVRIHASIGVGEARVVGDGSGIHTGIRRLHVDDERHVFVAELARAKKILLDFVAASEADLSEVRAGAELLRQARDSTATTRAIFDAAVAVRLGFVPARAVMHQEDLDELISHPGVARATAVLGPAHLPQLFPEVFLRDNAGFDVIVGNPPWDKVRWEAAPFWAKIRPGLMALPDGARSALIKQLRLEHPADAAHEQTQMEERKLLQEFYKRAYTWRGGTHLEAAQLMLERALRATRTGGAEALVLPRQMMVLAGWSKLRAELMQNRDLFMAQARNHHGWLFEGVEPRYAVVLLNAGPKTDAPIRVAVVASTDELLKLTPADAISMPIDELRQYSDGMVIPWFENPGDKSLFNKLRIFPRLKSGLGWIRATHDARWDFRSTGPDAKLASSVGSGDSWRVLMTRHVDSYSIRAAPKSKQFVSDLGAASVQALGVSYRDDKWVLSEGHPKLIIRHPSRSDDTRTMIATALPESGAFPNKGSVHAVSHASGTKTEAVLALLGLLNSATLDWWVRRFVDRHVTAPVVNNLPVPAWSTETIGRVASLVSTLLVRSGYTTIAGGENVEAWSTLGGQSDRSDYHLLAEIEAAVAEGFGLAPEDIDSVSCDFSEKGYPRDLVDRTKRAMEEHGASDAARIRNQ